MSEHKACCTNCTCGINKKSSMAEHVKMLEILERIEERIDSLDRKIELFAKNFYTQKK